VAERRAKIGADIGRGIRKLRKQKGWSQTELAKAAGLTLQTISLIETAKTNPSIFDLEEIAGALGATVPGLIAAARKSLRNKDQDLIDYVGNAVKTRRLELGLSKTELAQRADLLPQYISTTENCRRLVGLKNLFKLAKALEVDASYFFPGESLQVGEINTNSVHIGKVVKRLRTERGISRSGVTSITGMSEAQIANIELGSQTPRLSTIIALCRGLGISLHTFFNTRLD
jgi:transcriptional regulator with XRE-family HTH domain